MSEMRAGRIPVSVLTGFLGSGKTTLLNRILTERHGQRIAVIENEFGPENIDSDLLVRNGDEDIVEMSNGCLCCTVRGDLTRNLEDLARRRQKGDIRFDRVVIETTGLADPGPIAQTFFLEPTVAAHYVLDGILTVVDACHGIATLADQAEARAQVGYADRLLLSKVDLVDDQALRTLKEALVRINPRVPMAPMRHGQTDIRDLLEVAGYEPSAPLHDAFAGHEETHNHHTPDVASFAFKSDAPFDVDRLEQLLSALAEGLGTDLFRCKGVLWIHGNPRRVVLQAVQLTIATDVGEAWGDEMPQSRLVFIGRNLPAAEIIDSLERCLMKET